MLHIINKHDFNGGLFNQCLQVAENDSVILLIENGVYYGVETPMQSLDKRLLDKVSLFALMPDLEARGISLDLCYGVMKPIDYAGFVKLVADNNPIRSWF